MRKHFAIVVLGILGLIAAGAGPANAQQISEEEIRNPDPRFHPELMYFAHAVMENAIAQCRQRRISGEIKSFAESARCSNAKIVLAYGWINYPYMDLVRKLADQRLAASQRVDKGEWSEAHAQAYLAELGTTVNSEARRRHNLDIDSQQQTASTRTSDVIRQFASQRSIYDDISLR
ncbi:MAG: hypothetical protein U1F33_01835 [Alphaproteobacteria bacterium]